ncbi:MAG: AIR synthase related protein, partial [Myxococcota bacterium]
YDRPQKAPGLQSRATAEMTTVSREGTAYDLPKELLTLLASPNIGSRQWIYRQYDHVVRDGTIVGPGAGDAAVVRAFCETENGLLEKHLAIAVDCNGRHVKLDPFQGAAMAVAECARNIVCVGGKPLGTTDCLNFGNPETPETMWTFAQAIDGLAAACKALDVPVVSGNVSLYNETDGQPILPTPTVALVGLLARPEDRLTLAFAEEGHVIAHLGKPSEGRLGGSEWVVSKLGRVNGDPVGIDLEAEAALQRAVLSMAQRGLLASAHDVSDGGLGVSLAESCIAGSIGATVRLPGEDPRPEALLFSEEPSRIVVSFSADSQDAVRAICTEHGVPMNVLGITGGDTLTFEGHFTVPVAELADAHASALDSIVG